MRSKGTSWYGPRLRVYDMILGQYILTELGINLTLSEHVIEAYDGPFKESTTPMVDLGTYIFKV